MKIEAPLPCICGGRFIVRRSLGALRVYCPRCGAIDLFAEQEWQSIVEKWKTKDPSRGERRGFVFDEIYLQDYATCYSELCVIEEKFNAIFGVLSAHCPRETFGKLCDIRDSFKCIRNAIVVAYNKGIEEEKLSLE